MATTTTERELLVQVGPRDELSGVTVVSGGRHGIAVFASSVSDRVYAVDNRCPHMGFPLHKGSVRDGILTCHWHHARFDLESGGTFDRCDGCVVMGAFFLVSSGFRRCLNNFVHNCA